MAKILIVDDSADITEIVASRLEANNYDVAIAESGEEALEMVKPENPDLILLDISMPGIDGIETGRRLKADEETKAIPIVMITAKGDQNDIMLAIKEAQAVDYIVKPFRSDQLLEKIQRALAS
ncbi:MAG: response regulator [Candidatus Omnitrophica bacterium]|nr:response regulator [Candidatus Omnitrophota bacterium]